ncbi:MAG: hypothetical protein ABUL66_00260 [Verrucomicrobiota bacterium]
MASVLLLGCDARHQDERKAQRIACVNNLKQIGLAFRIWEGDHDDQFPFNASTNAGGTRELCASGKDGFDANACLHFQVMSNELNSTLVLICPQDRTKQSAVDFGRLTAANVTYRLRSGTNISDAHPREILAVCPVDGNILYCDGTVLDKNGKVPRIP